MRINIDDTDIGDDLIYRSRGKPFTGEVVETDQSGRVINLMTMVDGRAHGPELSWFPDGQLKTETTLKDGRPVGISRAWHANGQLADERVFDDRGFIIESRRWNEDGSPAPVQRRAVSQIELGSTRYYARLAAGRTAGNPSGVLRRRDDGDTVIDEAFTRNLRWEPTDYFDQVRLGHNDDNYVEITEAEAYEFVNRITAKMS